MQLTHVTRSRAWLYIYRKPMRLCKYLIAQAWPYKKSDEFIFIQTKDRDNLKNKLTAAPSDPKKKKDCF